MRYGILPIIFLISSKEKPHTFGVGQSGVTQASQRIALERSKDKDLRKIVKRIENDILL